MLRRNPNTIKLTKAYIESKVSHEAIASKYLNIPIEVVDDCVKRNHLIPSVFRDDDWYGSMGIQYNKKGRLKIRDFGGFGFFEDVYGTVAYVLSLVYDRKIDTNNKSDFYFVLKHIANTFNDIFNGKAVDPRIEDSLKQAMFKAKRKRAIIELVTRSWNNSDKKYPLCWDDRALEFDTKDQALEFFHSAIETCSSDDDFWKDNIIDEDILYYDGGYINASNMVAWYHPEKCDIVLAIRQL